MTISDRIQRQENEKRARIWDAYRAKFKMVKTWLLIIEDNYMSSISIALPWLTNTHSYHKLDYWYIPEDVQRYAIVIAYLPTKIMEHHKHANLFGYNDGYSAFERVAKWLPKFEYKLTDYGQAIQDFLKWREVICHSSNHTTHIDYHLEFAINAALDVVEFVHASNKHYKDWLELATTINAEFIKLDVAKIADLQYMHELAQEVDDFINGLLPDCLVAGPIEDDNSWGIMPNLDRYPLLEKYL